MEQSSSKELCSEYTLEIRSEFVLEAATFFFLSLDL